jgi:cyanophycinase
MPSPRIARIYLLFLLVCPMLAPAASAKWKYFRAGNSADSSAKPRGGYALMGGGAQQDPTFRLLCERANGGDFLILRADTEDDYAKKVNEEIKGLCPLNSVGTIVFTDREDSDDPKVVQTIEQAEAIFFAGGDQSNYVHFWQDTPVQDALNPHIASGKPIGGSSAALPSLGNSHLLPSSIRFIRRKPSPTRSGTKLQFPAIFCASRFSVARSQTRTSPRAIAWAAWSFSSRAFCRTAGQRESVPSRSKKMPPCSSSLMVLPRSLAPARPIFLRRNPPEVCRRKTPLRFRGISVHRAPPGTWFNVKTWSGEKGDDYQLSAENGELNAIGSSHGIC